jgi:hypothetical protein
MVSLNNLISLGFFETGAHFVRHIGLKLAILLPFEYGIGLLEYTTMPRII